MGVYVADMTIQYYLHRFGADEDAVGRLINGDLPTDDEERWRMVDAPRYRIQKLFDEHLRAQAALLDCQGAGKPFVLFLRSFSSEYSGNRIDRVVATQFSMHSVNFQQWLKFHLAKDKIPIIKLQGGADSFLSDSGDEAKVLSTHSDNWKLVAAELVQASSSIVFLISHMTAGVVEEFDLIRKFDQMHRCLVVLLDPSHTPDRDSDDTESIRARLADFPNIFELNLDSGGGAEYPENLVPILTELLHGARTQVPLEQALNVEFSYLEPAFAASEDFARTETYIWQQLRLLRVMFEDTYWAALKSNGIAFQHFTFSGAWKVAHQVYGLAIATADFRAIRETLTYLSLLYIFRGADFALLIQPLAAQYGLLATKILRDGELDTEALYASGPDPLKLPNKIGVAIKLFQHAEEAGRRQDSGAAVYLYQAAVIIALRARDIDDRERRWIVANMCRDWAKFQGESEQLEWAITNCTFAVTMFRDLVVTDPDRNMPKLALCLNNLGSLQFRQRNFSAADVSFVEALKIRRGLPPESENYLVNLYNSLANLGRLRVEIGKLDSARSLYSEALTVCEERMNADPGTIVDLTRLQGWMSLCLAKIPNTKREGLDYAQRAAGNLAAVSEISPESAAALRELVEEAFRVNNAKS
jgi:hypothetical protein